MSMYCWSVGGRQWRYLGRAVWSERWSEHFFLLGKRCRVWLLSGLGRSLAFSVLLQESSGSLEPSVHRLSQLQKPEQQQQKRLHKVTTLWKANVIIFAQKLRRSIRPKLFTSETDFSRCEINWNGRNKARLFPAQHLNAMPQSACWNSMNTNKLNENTVNQDKLQLRDSVIIKTIKNSLEFMIGDVSCKAACHFAVHRGRVSTANWESNRIWHFDEKSFPTCLYRQRGPKLSVCAGVRLWPPLAEEQWKC